ncbi:MAG: competence protein ComFC [Crocinitomicaceae bacterium]|jgi:competence protein ComFC
MQYDRLQYMRLVTLITQLFFPSSYTSEILNCIPSAPDPEHAHIFSLYDYHKPKGKKLVYAIKQKRDNYLDHIIAEKMKIHLLSELSEQYQYSYFLNPLVIPVPLHLQRLHERGFNQSAGIAKELARKLPGRYMQNILFKAKKTQKQALLKNKSERIKNIKGCFRVKNKYIEYIYQKDIIIVDDLVTTGATLLECTKILKKYGARNIIAITVAH